MRHTPLIASLVLAACSQGPSIPEAIRTDSAGIEIVTGPATDRILDWSVLPADTLVDPAIDTTLQTEVRFLRFGSDAQGGLAFADGGFTDPRILRRTSGGEWHQVGRKGGGPGEYQIVGQLAVSPEGELLIGDLAKRSYLRFGPTDSVLPPIPWSAFGKGFAQTASYVAGGIVAMFSEMSESTSVRTLRYLSPLDTTEIVASRGPAPKELDYSKSCSVTFMGGPIFETPLLMTGNREAVAYSTTDRYEIVVWRGGKVVRILRRPIPPRAATEALARQEIGPGHDMSIGGRPCRIPADDIIAQQGLAPNVPAVRHLTMAPDGTLWVRRFTVKGEVPLRDVFDSSGAYLGTLSGNTPWPQAWFADGRFVSISGNEDSLPVVVRYMVGGATRRE